MDAGSRGRTMLTFKIVSEGGGETDYRRVDFVFLSVVVEHVCFGDDKHSEAVQ